MIGGKTSETKCKPPDCLTFEAMYSIQIWKNINIKKSFKFKPAKTRAAPIHWRSVRAFPKSATEANTVKNFL